jgi:hypothetical protein
VNTVFLVLPDVPAAAAAAEREHLARMLLAAGYEPRSLDTADALSALSTHNAGAHFVIDVESSVILEAFLMASPEVAERTVLLTSVEASMLSRVQTAAGRNVLGFFLRPCDLETIAMRLPPLPRASERPSSSEHPRIPSAPPSTALLPPLGIRQSAHPPAPSSPVPKSTPAPTSAPSSPPRPSERPDSFGPQASHTSLSAELATLLSDAESRLRTGRPAEHAQEEDGLLLSPEDEVENVLPQDVLAALDLPLDDDREDFLTDTVHGTMSTAGKTTEGSFDHQTTGTGRDRTENLSTPEPAELRAPHAEARVTKPAALRERERETLRRVITHQRDTFSALADPIIKHASCILTFESHGEPQSRIFRLVLSEGAITSVASTAEDDSLVLFLVERGDLLKSDAESLLRKIPREPRYSAAALVAHGILENEELWDVLRSHAAWLLVKLGGLGRASVTQEPHATDRDAPSVFGASTGAAIFVDTVRRTVSPADAEQELGGLQAIFGDGPQASLLEECALEETLQNMQIACVGKTLADILKQALAPNDDVTVVLYALTLLGVFEGHERSQKPKAPDSRRGEQNAERELDDETRRQRIKARAALVSDGDYFSLLGVAEAATGYEIRKSFLALRREFEPSRILTSRTLDLKDDVLRIVYVLEEAYEILRDNVRRERYRKAIRLASSRPGEL